MACSMNDEVIKTKMSLALIRVGLAAYAKIQCEFQRNPHLDLDLDLDLHLDLDLDLPVCLVGKSAEWKGNNNLDMPWGGP